LGTQKTVTGLHRADRRIIATLRQQFNKAFGGRNIGDSIIRCGDKNKYRIDIEPDHIKRDRSFDELEPSHFSSTEVADIIPQSCGAV
jgi:hypothetical protein